MRNIILLLVFISVKILTAQNTTLNRIVWLKNPETSIQSFLRDFESAHEIYAPMGLWEVKSDIAGADVSFNSDRYWENLSVVRTTHLNRQLTKRISPNDAFYGNQPYLGHIGLEYIWNYQKNGVNFYGDSVVIAYIDDGADTSHPDLKGNLYKNKNEIPWNGIDDDGNGYVDDYQGWNSGEQSPLVFSSVSVLDGHGTNVAGVLGAKGNNNIGITGVNWGIKILPINTYPDNLLNIESAVLRGMIYVFKQKQLFLKSQKTKGINVVALNMSLGMDNAFPSDAEYWCTLFDSLGSVGVWSYNATTNRNVDVGVNGDIPTLCKSPFLISVNASNIEDVHYSSGFSDSFVELAAPGVNIYVTTPVSFNSSKPYTSETGTSFASPMVAGISALIETMACKAYLDLKIADPDSAMGLWREWFKASVAKNNNLKAKTAWGGRVDAEGLWNEMVSWCNNFDTSYLGSEKFIAKEHFNIFPNPSGAKCTIWSSKAGILEVFDATGRQVAAIIVESGHNFWEFEGADGLYLGVLKDVDGGIHKKVHYFSRG